MNQLTPEVRLRARDMLQGVMARSWLQPLWRGLFHVSALGMGFSAINPQFNGELRFPEALVRMGAR